MKGLARAVVVFGIAGLAHLSATAAAPQGDASATGGQVRTYYVAAEEVDWDYAPLGIDMMTGKPFEGTSAAYTQPGPTHIGHVYRKAVYREYTDGTFATRTPRPPQDDYLGLLGPILRAEVGDTIKVVFKNNASRPYGMHAPYVFRLRNATGAGNVPDATGNVVDAAPEDVVAPGATFTYEWDVSQNAGPEPKDTSSTVWVYHSNASEYRDVATGLVGPIIVTRRGQANADGTPKDADREIVALFAAFDENESWYLQENVAAHINGPDQKALAGEASANFSDAQGVCRHRIRRDQLQVFGQWIPLRRWAGDDRDPGPARTLVHVGHGERGRAQFPHPALARQHGALSRHSQGHDLSIAFGNGNRRHGS